MISPRLLWTVAVLIFGMLMCVLCWSQWLQYATSPTVTKIADNDLPTYSVAFPAVTICPAAKVKHEVLQSKLME